MKTIRNPTVITKRAITERIECGCCGSGGYCNALLGTKKTELGGLVQPYVLSLLKLPIKAEPWTLAAILGSYFQAAHKRPMLSTGTASTMSRRLPVTAVLIAECIQRISRRSQFVGRTYS